MRTAVAAAIAPAMTTTKPVRRGERRIETSTRNCRSHPFRGQGLLLRPTSWSLRIFAPGRASSSAVLLRADPRNARWSLDPLSQRGAPRTQSPAFRSPGRASSHLLIPRLADGRARRSRYLEPDVVARAVPSGEEGNRDRAYLPCMGSGRRGTAHRATQRGALPDPIILDIRYRPPESGSETRADLARQLNAEIYKAGNSSWPFSVHADAWPRSSGRSGTM